MTLAANIVGRVRPGSRHLVGEVWRLEARRAVLWLPVFLGGGIWLYFALPAEPPLWSAFLWFVPLGWLVAGLPGSGGLAGRVILLALVAAAAGFALAKGATLRTAAPVLPWPMSETVEGRVIGLGRSASGAPRVLLDRVVIYGLERAETPQRVRVALLAAERETAPEPGSRLRVYARLSPPPGPVEPGAFDFRLRAWFDRLGAVGYARAPAVVLPRAPTVGGFDRIGIWLAKTRLRIADGLRHAIPGAEGAFAAAIVTGDRSAIDESDAEALRLSNLAHLLAISGLHMGMLTGLVFAVARLSLALLPGGGLRISSKKLAAIAALAAGAAYLALSGATVATQRAFVMAAVAFSAVLLDRPAISLRALAVAATIVLVMRPVSLLEVGFQMSFAATAALVAGWEVIRAPRARRGSETGVLARLAGRLLLYAGALVFTSLLAGLATAPYAAWHFNRTAPWGLLANLAAVPAMGIVIAPSAIVAGVLAPFGLEGPPLALMGQGIGWVLKVAHFVAGLPGAAQPVRAAGPAVLALMTLGGLWLCLWRGWWRLFGVLPLAVAMLLWARDVPRPDLLIAPDAALIGLMGPEGRTLSHERAASFAADSWLRRDGDLTTQEEAFARPGLETWRGGARGALPDGWTVELVTGRKPDPGRLLLLCRPTVLLIARHGGKVEGPCLYIGRSALRRGGAVAVRLDGGQPRMVFSEMGGFRPWSAPPTRR